MPKTYKVVDPSTLDPRGGPRQLVRKADAAGFVVEVRRSRTLNLIVVGGVNAERGLAFEARWLDKSVTARLWEEVDRGYDEVEAPARVKIGKTQATRPTGYVAGVRLVYRGGPRGVRLSITELKDRIAA